MSMPSRRKGRGDSHPYPPGLANAILWWWQHLNQYLFYLFHHCSSGQKEVNVIEGGKEEEREAAV